MLALGCEYLVGIHKVVPTTTLETPEAGEKCKLKRTRNFVYFDASIQQPSQVRTPKNAIKSTMSPKEIGVSAIGRGFDFIHFGLSVRRAIRVRFHNKGQID